MQQPSVIVPPSGSGRPTPQMPPEWTLSRGLRRTGQQGSALQVFLPNFRRIESVPFGTEFSYNYLDHNSILRCIIDNKYMYCSLELLAEVLIWSKSGRFKTSMFRLLLAKL